MLAAAESTDQLQLKLLKVFSEMCAYCGTLEKQAEKVEAVFNVLLVSSKNLFEMFLNSKFQLFLLGIYATSTNGCRHI